MRFQVVDSRPSSSLREPETVYLWSTGWDDWWRFSTSHSVMYVDAEGESHSLGITKIGEFGLQPAGKGEERPGYRAPIIPRSFESLDQQFFSLGQDADYYTDLDNLGPSFRDVFLRALNDIAYEPTLRLTALAEPVTAVSLLRDVSVKTVADQYHRLARGGVPLTGYNFRFTRKKLPGPPLRVTFDVNPNSRPPTNVHVVIGRNGVGKSTLLNRIARAVVKPDRGGSSAHSSGIDQLSNVVSVSFSAFDAFEPISVPQDRSKGVTYHYVGLKKISSRSRAEEMDEPDITDSPIANTKDESALSREMTLAAKSCLEGARRARWLNALRLLCSDPIFNSLGLIELFEGESSDKVALRELRDVFKDLSSGHKIVLLTMTKLVETVQEKSLVLLDEPEAHLHPPLLSAFVRAVSDLLNNRNGVAIVATHSPVVLQEVPSSCVWKLQRSGESVVAERPRIETFGENVGTLTDEVFGLEVADTGFHRMLHEAAADSFDYEDALSKFDAQLGAEGRALLRLMMLERSRQDDVAY